MLELYKDYKATALNKDFRLFLRNKYKDLEMKEVEVEIKPEFTQINKKTGKQLDVFKNDYIIETDLRTKEQKIVQEPADIVEQKRQAELKDRFERAEAKRLETEKMVNRIQANLTMRKGSQRKR
jgi:hypothetical protein